MEPSCTNVDALLYACEVESCGVPCVGVASDAGKPEKDDAAYETVVFSCTYTAAPRECIQHDTLPATLLPSSQTSCTASGGLPASERRSNDHGVKHSAVAVRVRLNAPHAVLVCR